MWEHGKKLISLFNIKDTLKIDIGENDYNRIQRVGPKITNNNGQVLQQIIVKFKGSISRSSVY